MEITAEEIINGLLEEIKRLTLDNVALKITLSKQEQDEKNQ
jgi:hypothetical protein